MIVRSITTSAQKVIGFSASGSIFVSTKPFIHMTRTILLSSFMLAQVGLFAQCTGQIPANATIVDGDTPVGAVSGSNQTFWVCGDAFQNLLTGNNNQVYIESGAFVSINGNGNTVRYKGNIPLGIFGSNNVIYATATTAVSNQGTGNTVNTCGTGGVVFNYSTAPAGGCNVVGIEEELLASLKVNYDVASEMLLIKAPDVQVEQVRIFNMGGQEIVSTRHAGTPILLNKLAAGSYVVRLDTDQGTVMRRFVN